MRPPARRAREVVLLDLDGTLTDNFAGISRSIAHALVALGEPAPDPSTLTDCVGPPLRHSFARLLATDDAALIERAIVHYRERYSATGWQENVVYAGIPAMLAALRRGGRRLLLCTSKPQPFAERIVERFGLVGHLAGVYGADLRGTLDDKGALVAHVVERERLDPERCAMVGDREHDIHAARRHRIRAIGVLWGYGSRAELERAGADAIAADPAALPAFIDADG
jgi:phosphoglycolate phosphatase